MAFWLSCRLWSSFLQVHLAGATQAVWAEVAGRMEGRHWEPGLCPSTPTPICSHSVGEKIL